MGRPQRQKQTIVDSHSTQGKGVLAQKLEALKEKGKVHARGISIDHFVEQEKNFIQPGGVPRRVECV